MDDLDLIRQKINIVDLIQEYLPLKKAGVNFKTLCPFHSEKTASFIVSPERQIWHCFGCQKGGDIFKFLMEKEGMDFKEALEFLAQKAGVTLKRTAPQKDQKDRLYEANLKAQQFFHYILTKHNLGQKALHYLQKRGLKLESVEQFGLGYAPNSWESLSKFLLNRGFKTEEIIASGLAVASKNGCYDRFRGRVIFAMTDQKDKILGFSGRVLDKGEPKYINSPQTLIFDKGNFLFGLNLAKGEIRAQKEAVLVEGEMDVILSHQAEVKNAVASKGTALTAGQIELLKKYAENITLCYDSDLAGDAASRRGIEMADSAGLNIKVVPMKEGKDPAELSLKNPQGLLQAVQEAIPIYDFYLQSAEKRYSAKDPLGAKKIFQELVPIWSKISDDLLREHYIQKLATLLRSDEKIIRAAVSKQRRFSSRPIDYRDMLQQTSDDVLISPRGRRELLEEYLIALLLHIPPEHLYVPSFPETIFLSETLRQIYVLLVLYLDSISFKGQDFNINDFIKTTPPQLTGEIDRLYLVDIEPKLLQKAWWQKEVDMVVSELKKALIKASLERLSLEIKNAEQFGKMELTEALNRRFRDLSVKLKNL